MSRYSIQMVDGDEPAAWMRLLSSATPGPQDGGHVRLDVEVPDHLAARLERALDRDDDVLGYEVLPAAVRS